MTSNYPPPPEPGDPGQQPPASAPTSQPYPAGQGDMPAYPQGTERPVAQVAQPPSMVTAVRLMWAGAALSVISLLVGLLTLGSLKDNIKQQLSDDNKTYTQSDIDTAYNIGIAFIVIVGVLGVALWLLMAYANGNGRKWARIVATVLGALSVLFTILSLAQGQSPASSQIIAVIGAVLAIAILVLLWRKESTEFYNARSRPQFG